MKEKLTITLAEVKLGDTIASDITDNIGNCIVSEGIVLDDKLLTGLLKRDIDNLEVFRNKQLSEEEKQNKIAELTSQVDSRFHNMKDVPIMQKLKKIVVQYRIQGIE